jgi:hypothetical protein
MYLPAFYTTAPGRLRSVDGLYLVCGSTRRCRGTRCIRVSASDLCVHGCPAPLSATALLRPRLLDDALSQGVAPPLWDDAVIPCAVPLPSPDSRYGSRRRPRP